ncbi:hypothetical protein ElyMa_002500900 [Elysia marginata]|uniref:G-protein coupled receptors family 1 profile domain-containing protein n=1 Tax=Elysia marginata TaxID=1093978 RepID=A0AAV4GSA8_9GAST|nr:hypothetical protein ElyMa_002500900 [Elysia marginata]
MRKLSCVASKIDPDRGWWLNIIFLPQVYMFNRVFDHVTSFTTMIISIERFVAVVWPFKVNLLITKTRMVVVIIFIYVLSFALQGLFFFIYEIRWKTSEDGRRFPSYRTTSLYQRNEKAIIAYNSLVLSNILVFAPMIVVRFCSVVILHKITASMR